MRPLLTASSLLLCLAVLAPLSAFAQAAPSPYVEVTGGTDKAVKGTYRDLPANSKIILVSFSSGSVAKGVKEVTVKKGGNGTFSVSIPKSYGDQSDSLYKFRAVSASNAATVYDESQHFSFEIGPKKAPTCSMKTSTATARAGEPFKISWSSKGAATGWGDKVSKEMYGEIPLKGSAYVTRTVPGVHFIDTSFTNKKGIKGSCWINVTVY